MCSTTQMLRLCQQVVTNMHEHMVGFTCTRPRVKRHNADHVATQQAPPARTRTKKLPGVCVQDVTIFPHRRLVVNSDGRRTAARTEHSPEVLAQCATTIRARMLSRVNSTTLSRCSGSVEFRDGGWRHSDLLASPNGVVVLTVRENTQLVRSLHPREKLCEARAGGAPKVTERIELVAAEKRLVEIEHEKGLVVGRRGARQRASSAHSEHAAHARYARTNPSLEYTQDEHARACMPEHGVHT